MINRVRLGVNIDHVATIRNARGGPHPDPVRAAKVAAQAGADGITAHLREDRRHISDDDIARLARDLTLPLNLEMAATDEMLAIALAHKPHAACLVPEKREEKTTEGGLDVARDHRVLETYIARLKQAGIRVSLFIDPDKVQLHVAHALGADVVELHTGTYCAQVQAGEKIMAARELDRLAKAAAEGAGLGLEIHAGHGLDFETTAQVAAILEIKEFNIGHFLVGEAIFGGFDATIRRMRAGIDTARAQALGRPMAG